MQNISTKDPCFATSIKTENQCKRRFIMRTNNGQGNRNDKLIKEDIHDPYMKRSKPVSPTVCPECGAVFINGRWQWLDRVEPNANQELCPACQRIRDNVPAGILTLKGDFLSAHRDEIMRLIENKVEVQKADHPMKRIMTLEEAEDGSTIVTFTDTHLPRGVGQAIQSAYGGDLEIQYPEDAQIVRVYWERQA
jgi:NMD protein affecting ribosome stability and mRNA decay